MSDHGSPVVLTIAGSDSGGGAGIQADLKTFAAFGVYGTSAITAVTAQNTTGVQGVEMLPPEFVAKQITSVLSDFNVAAVKIGMLGNAEIVTAVCGALDRFDGPVVLDPVMVATSGDMLLEAEAVDAMKREMIPAAMLLTPNLPEAALLLGRAEAGTLDEMSDQATRLRGLGCRSVLLKGGHLEGAGGVLTDVLASEDGVELFETPRVGGDDLGEVHGTGCTLSSAIVAGLALGRPVDQAIRDAQMFVGDAIRAAFPARYGAGALAMHHAGARPIIKK